MRTTTHISERIAEWNQKTLSAAGSRYECDEVGCEVEPTHVCRVVAERTPTEDRTLWLCEGHAARFSATEEAA